MIEHVRALVEHGDKGTMQNSKIVFETHIKNTSNTKTSHNNGIQVRQS